MTYPELSCVNVYEKSFNEQPALLVCALSRADKLHEAAQSDDPTQAVIDLFGNDELMITIVVKEALLRKERRSA